MLSTTALITEDAHIPVAIAATARAVASALPFLDVDMIMHPRDGATDGSPFARFIVIHLLVTVFDVPKKRLYALRVSELKKIKQGCRVIEARLQDRPRFAEWLNAIAAEAVATFRIEVDDA